MATYLTSVTHYPYMMPEGYEEENFSEDEDLNRYLNAIRLQGYFLESLSEQYKALGLDDDTVFVVFGDHGQGFGEHGRFMHGDTIYEEGLQVPLLIHDPRKFRGGERVTGLSSQIDVLPTVVEMLGYRVRGGECPGYSLLGELPEDRPLNFSCWGAEACLVSLQGTEKYTYFLITSPRRSSISRKTRWSRKTWQERPEDVEERRNELLAWRSKIDAIYRGSQRE